MERYNLIVLSAGSGALAVMRGAAFAAASHAGTEKR